jgi:LacI family transcriptional regulator
VAVRAGTSTAVVSYVLNDGPRPVAPDTRRRVLEAIEDLDYRPHALARGLRSRRTGSLGLLVPDLRSPFFAEVAAAVERAAADRGVRVLVATSQSEAAREAGQVRMLLDARVDGVIVTPTRAPGPLVRAVRASGTRPVVLLHRSAGVRNVVAGDREAGAAAVAHLVEEHGHRVVGLLRSGPRGAPVDLRATGALAAVDRLLPDLDRTDLVRDCAFPALTQVARRETLDLLARRPDVTALVAVTDRHALGAMRAAAEAGRVVGRDLALVSLDGTALTGFLHPPLTVLRAPFEALGEAAVAGVLGVGPEDRTTLPMELLVRSSCGCYRG